MATTGTDGGFQPGATSWAIIGKLRSKATDVATNATSDGYVVKDGSFCGSGNIKLSVTRLVASIESSQSFVVDGLQAQVRSAYPFYLRVVPSSPGRGP